MSPTGTASVFDALALIADFDDSLLSENIENNSVNVDPGKRRQLFIQHLKRMDKLNYIIPNFKENLNWLNVSEPLSMDGKLNGCLVVLDFFTYCCINCMHILPDLEALEEKYPPESGVVVIGVHSAKFLNEKVTANILSAILRYNITHPVVNDSEASLWQELSISCWPTLVFLGPSGQFLYSLAGEGRLSRILEFVDIAKDYYTDLSLIKPHPLPIHLEVNKKESTVLSFPGKVTLWKERDWLVVTDSGHHRIIVTDLTGVVQEVIGNGARGFKDGAWSEASFSSPQGVACQRDALFVADTDNHAVRLVNYSNRSVTTLTGTGRQGLDKEGGKTFTDQEISSPWDVTLGCSQDNKDASDPDVLFIAMAGTHQVWVYFLRDASWYKNRQYAKDTCVRFAGNGQEANRNNSYPEKASFAQPSGMAMCHSRNMLYIADSESSSIRSLALKDGKVSGLVGGERDPTNLFAFGDIDGKGVNAKLQHPLGVTLQTQSGPLLVADSYNHKIKMVDIETQECTTLAGTGQPGNEVNQKDLSLCQFNEPGGLTCNESAATVFVADTNNHSIKVIDLTKRTISELAVIFPKEDKCSSNTEKKFMEYSTVGCLLPLTVSAVDRSVTLTVPISAPDGHHFNVDAPNSFRIEPYDEYEIDLSKLVSPLNRKGTILVPQPAHGRNGKLSINLSLNDQISAGTFIFKLCVQYFLCLDEGNVCLPPIVSSFKQTIHVQAG